MGWTCVRNLGPRWGPNSLSWVGAAFVVLVGCGGKATLSAGAESDEDDVGSEGSATTGSGGSSATNAVGSTGTRGSNAETSAGVTGTGGTRGSDDTSSSTTSATTRGGLGGEGGDLALDNVDNPAIEGELNGATVAIGDLDQTHGFTATVGDDVWTATGSYADATVYLWNQGDGGFGLVEVPFQGQGARAWICLAEVRTDADDRGGSPSVWSASSLSRLPNCSLESSGALTLAFEMFGPVEGTLRGEALDWEYFASARYPTEPEFTFSTPSGEMVTLSLQLSSELEDPGQSDVEEALLVKTGELGAVACGAGGLVSVEFEYSYTVFIEQFGSWRMCPGVPVDGELHGEFSAP